MIQPGIYDSMTNAEYHADNGSVSRSGLMEYRRSPYHYWNAYINPDRPQKEATEAMGFGDAFHTLVLEPREFDKRYAIRPEGIDRRTKQGKADFEDFLSKSGGKIILDTEQIETLRQMQQSVYRHQQAWNLVSEALYEHSIFWIDPHSGLTCKVRPDIWHSNIIVDLKTTASADARSFQGAIATYGYHIQAAMMRDAVRYTTGEDIRKFVFIACEKSFPFCVVPYIIDDHALDVGHNEYKNLLMRLKDSREKNTWEGYQTKTVSLPAWYQENTY